MQIVFDDMAAEHYARALSGLLHAVVSITTEPRTQPGNESPPEPEFVAGVVYVVDQMGIGLYTGYAVTPDVERLSRIHSPAVTARPEVVMVQWSEIDTVEVLTTPEGVATEWSTWTATLSPGARDVVDSMNQGLAQAQQRSERLRRDVTEHPRAETDDERRERLEHPSGRSAGKLGRWRDEGAPKPKLRLPEAFREHDDIDARPEDSTSTLTEQWGPKNTGTPPPPITPGTGLTLDTESDYRGLGDLALEGATDEALGADGGPWAHDAPPQAGDESGDTGSVIRDALRTVGRDDGRPRAWIDSPVAQAMSEHDVVAGAEHLFVTSDRIWRQEREGNWTPIEPGDPGAAEAHALMNSVVPGEPAPWPTDERGMFIADRRNVGHPPYRLRGNPSNPPVATGVTEALAHALDGDVMHARETVTVEHTATIVEGQAAHDEIIQSYQAVADADTFLPHHRGPNDLGQHVVRGFDDTSTM